MKVKALLGFLALALLVLDRPAAAPVRAQSPSGSHLRLLHDSEQAVVLELTVDDFQVETVEAGGRTYHRLLIGDTVQTVTPGAPQAATCGTLLGLPSIEGVSVQVLAADYETLDGFDLAPAPHVRVSKDNLDDLVAADVQQAFAPDQDIYSTDAFYPGAPVKVGDAGYMRDQAVAQVQFYPVQYNPVTGKVRFYRHILARITWLTPLPVVTADNRGASSAYENLLKKALLNYDALERLPVAEAARPVGAAGTTIVAAGSPTTSLKIGVTEDGLYELTYGDLTGAGLDLSGVDPRTIKISHRGTEVPVFVQGEGDGVFDATDYVLFYGTGLTDIYTTTNVYWLTAGGDPGRRMAMQDGSLSGSAAVPTYFPVTLHAEEDSYYWQSMPAGEGQDHWFWGDRLTAPASSPHSVVLDHISEYASTATVRVRLKGRTDTATNPDHHSRIYLNGSEIDDQWWDGQIIYDHETTVPHDLLDEGSNSVTVETVGDSGAVVDQLFVNWIEIDYWDTYVAEEDELLFGAPTAGTFQFEVTGFSSNDVQVFDVMDPASVALVTHTTVLGSGGSYRLQFEDTAQAETRYLALTSARRKSPASMELDHASSWKDTRNGADYIVITHEDFYTHALALAHHRSALGLRAATVKVEDIYDEFNHGIFSPQAIRDFLSFTYHHWIAPAPTYVLLVGDACQDYKDNLGTGTMNYVPSQIVETELAGEAPSDNWFVLVSGDDVLPDMFISRLPSQTASEAEDMVDKMIAYEDNPPDATWDDKALFVADDDSSAFELTSEQLADILLHDFTANKVYVSQYPPGDPTVDIKNYINQGSVLVSYAGHGTTSSWGWWGGDDDWFFDSGDVAALNNTNKLPVVTAADCLNGYFVHTSRSCMAEEFLLLEDKGAVAVWAATSLGYPSSHRMMFREFYEAIFQDNLYALGTATTAAKIAAYSQDSSLDELVETFVLFGDPATQLSAFTHLKSTTPADGASRVPPDQTIRITFSKPMIPSTVMLDVQGTAGLDLIPTWSGDNTTVDYAHADFYPGLRLTLSLSGQDEARKPLGSGVIPTTWSFTVLNGNTTIYLPLVVKQR